VDQLAALFAGLFAVAVPVEAARRLRLCYEAISHRAIMTALCSCQSQRSRIMRSKKSQLHFAGAALAIFLLSAIGIAAQPSRAGPFWRFPSGTTHSQSWTRIRCK